MLRPLRPIQCPQSYTKSPILKWVANNVINNNEIYLPESNVYFKNCHSTTLRNQIESSDGTFEELSIYTENNFKECFNITCNRNKKNVSFWGFLVKVNYHSVPIIVTDQLNKNKWKSLNSGTVYTKLSQLNNFKSHLNYTWVKKWMSQRSQMIEISYIAI